MCGDRRRKESQQGKIQGEPAGEISGTRRCPELRSTREQIKE